MRPLSRVVIGTTFLSVRSLYIVLFPTLNFHLSARSFPIAATLPNGVGNEGRLLKVYLVLGRPVNGSRCGPVCIYHTDYGRPSVRHGCLLEIIAFYCKSSDFTMTSGDSAYVKSLLVITSHSHFVSSLCSSITPLTRGLTLKHSPLDFVGRVLSFFSILREIDVAPSNSLRVLSFNPNGNFFKPVCDVLAL